MSFCIVHLSDPHFGTHADLRQVHAAEDLIPDLEPRVAGSNRIVGAFRASGNQRRRARDAGKRC